MTPEMTRWTPPDGTAVPGLATPPETETRRPTTGGRHRDASTDPTAWWSRVRSPVRPNGRVTTWPCGVVSRGGHRFCKPGGSSSPDGRGARRIRRLGGNRWVDRLGHACGLVRTRARLVEQQQLRESVLRA